MSDEVEELLRPPLRFDPDIGYWTGEADLELLYRVLAQVPEDPRVERRVDNGELWLRGPAEAVWAEASLLREAGLE